MQLLHLGITTNQNIRGQINSTRNDALNIQGLLLSLQIFPKLGERNCFRCNEPGHVTSQCNNQGNECRVTDVPVAIHQE